MTDDPIDDPIDETYEVGRIGREAHLFVDWPGLLDCGRQLPPGRYFVRRVAIDRGSAPPTSMWYRWGEIEVDVDRRGRWHLVAFDGSVDLKNR